MSERGRGVRPSPKINRVAKCGTIMAAFQRQMRKKNCPLCGQSVFLPQYKAHFDNCQLASNDSDCEIVQCLSAAESRALQIGPPIVIDEENSCSEHQTALEQHRQFRNTKERRSRRLEAPTTAYEKIETFKLENTQISVQESNISGRKKPDKSNNVFVKAEKSTRSMNCDSPLLSRKPADPKHMGEDRMKFVQNHITADELVEKIDDLFTSFRTYVSCQKATSDQDNLEESRSVPYIVKSTLKIMRRVLLSVKMDGSRYDESFWLEDCSVFHRFLGISKNARELFMRMVLRKPFWMSLTKLKDRYSELSSSIDPALVELLDNDLIEGEKNLSCLQDALKIAPLPVLRTMAKKYQLDFTKGKVELISTLTSFAATQKSLFGQMGAVTKTMLKALKIELGPCYRVNRRASMLFKALFTLYAPTEMCSTLVADQPNLNVSQNLLFILLRMEQGAIKFPAPNPCQNIISIFGSKMELMAYMDAKELETEILGFLSSNKFPDAYECAVKARELLTGHCEESRLRAAGLPVFLRRFTTFAVLMRCIIHGTGVLERQKKYAVAISWQRFLLKTPEFKPFCANSRGALWDRLALNLDAHMKEREEALQEIEEGMNDDAVAAKDKLMLQDRAMKISNRDFLERIIIREPVKKEIYGITLSKNLGDSRVNRFVLRDSNGEFVQCAVEEVVRKHYLENEGFNNGVHAEGSIWHTVLGLLFYDIIFDYDVKNVWFSELQTNPVDLNSRDLYKSRQQRFDERFRSLENASEEELTEQITMTWNVQSHVETSEIHWELFKCIQDFLDFLFCCPRLALLSILKRIVMDYRNCRSGFPDLTMWNTVTKTVAVIEVKGPNDRLSTKQRLWLDFFMSQDIRAEVCHVIAKNEREL